MRIGGGRPTPLTARELLHPSKNPWRTPGQRKILATKYPPCVLASARSANGPVQHSLCLVRRRFLAPGDPWTMSKGIAFEGKHQNKQRQGHLSSRCQTIMGGSWAPLLSRIRLAQSTCLFRPEVLCCVQSTQRRAATAEKKPTEDLPTEAPAQSPGRQALPDRLCLGRLPGLGSRGEMLDKNISVTSADSLILEFVDSLNGQEQSQSANRPVFQGSRQVFLCWHCLL